VVQPLLIKKYVNRRLYDTEASRYITLEELAGLIRGGREVRVVDAKTNADLTKMVLLQIISETEKADDVLPVSFLRKVIQFSDSSAREALQRYLSFSLDSFMNAQRDLQTQYQNLAGSFLNPLAWMSGASPTGAPPSAPMPPAAPEAPFAQSPAPPEPEVPPGVDATQSAPEDVSELEQLKEQMSKMQQLFDKLASNDK